MVLIVPYDHPLANYDHVDLKDTIEFPYILYSEKNDFRKIIDAYLIMWELLHKLLVK